jgi:hypothetical protein
MASAENRNNAVVGPGQLSTKEVDLPEMNLGISYCAPAIDGMIYQQQQSPAPLASTKGVPLAPYNNTMSFMGYMCDFSTTCSPPNTTPSLSTFCGSPFPQYPDVQLNASGEEFLYSDSFEDAQEGYLGSVSPECSGYGHYPPLDYSQLSVPSLGYTSLAAGQDMLLLRPSRSSSLNSYRSSTF